MKEIPMQTLPTAADVIARRLAEVGCRFAFGMPGGEVVALVDALDRAGIRFVLTRHENAAGFMAEGAFHASGAPGILVTTLGPGLANAVNVIANAQQDRVPLIVLSGCVDAAESFAYTHQVIDHGALLRPVVKDTIVAHDGAVDAVIRHAIALATADQPGPVHVDLPVGTAGRVQTMWPGPCRPASARALAEEGDVVRAARRALADAERPLVIAGLDAVRHGAGEVLTREASRLGVPVITTYKAKGLVPESDGISLGAAGLSPLADRHLLPLVRSSDLVILAGHDPIEMRQGWRMPFAPEATVIELSPTAIRHGMFAAALRLPGDVTEALVALFAGATPKPVWPGGEPAAVRPALAAAFAPRASWGPHAVFDILCRRVGDEMLVTVDSGAHRILLSQMWRSERPGRLLQSSGFCTMASALPLAMGWSIASGGRRAVAVMGDAGLEMVLGELATCRDLALPLTLVVLVDRSLALIALKQKAAGLRPLGVAFGGTDFAAVARALGGDGFTATTPMELEDSLTVALHSPRFAIVACVVDAADYEGSF